MSLKIRLLFSILVVIIHVNAQEKLSKTYTLSDAISLAQLNSVSYKIAVNKATRNHWRYKNYKANFLPRLSLFSTLPNYNRAINEITQPDGSIQFRAQEYMNTSVGLRIDQNVSFTGGTFSLYSSLNRLDNFGQNPYTRYNSIPLSISYSQSSFVYNRFKWLRKIEPIIAEKTTKEYTEEMENISMEAVNYFFSYLTAQNSLETSELNHAINDTLYNISKSRFNLGKINQNDLLQMELNLLNSENEISQRTMEFEKVRQNFYRYLGFKNDENVKLQLPLTVAELNVDRNIALSMAEKNRAKVLEFKQRRLQAEEEVAKARAENAVSINLSANFGYSQSGNTFNEAYINPLDQQQVSLTLSIPLIDWGVSSSRKKMAEADLDLELNNIENEQQAFEQEITLLCMQVEIDFRQLKTAEKSKTIAEKRYEIAVKRYKLGNMSITDLNIAQKEKDSAILSYYSNLQKYWSSYYNLRKLTHYDFVEQKQIEYQIEI
jgi:hypothetical protein